MKTACYQFVRFLTLMFLDYQGYYLTARRGVTLPSHIVGRRFRWIFLLKQNFKVGQFNSFQVENVLFNLPSYFRNCLWPWYLLLAKHVLSQVILLIDPCYISNLRKAKNTFCKKKTLRYLDKKNCLCTFSQLDCCIT